MPLPEVIRRFTFQPPARAAADAALETRAADDPGFIIPLPFRYQAQLNWCWAAVGLALGIRAGRRATDYTQCEYAGEFVGGACCPNGAAAGSCNVQRSFHSVLVSFGWPDTFENYTLHALSFERIVELLNDWRPVVAQIDWNGAGTHFVVVTGYQVEDGVKWVYLRDPFDGSWDTLAPGQYDRCIPYEGLFAYSRDADDPDGETTGVWRWTFHPRVQ